MINYFYNHFKKDINNNPGVSPELISEIEAEIGVNFPKDYVELMSRINGMEGSVGNSYIRLWAINELIEMNEGYSVQEFAPGILLIGTDGGGEAFAFDLRDNEMKIIQIPFIPMDVDNIIFCGNDLNSFYNYLLNE
jgi:phosphoribosylaminoimidazole (AIR) synthetase